MHSVRAGRRHLWLSALAVVALGLLGTGGVASAKSCPNSSKTTVSGKPSYTYTRGCIVSFDGASIVYNLFEPLNPARHSVYPIMEGPGWGGAGATSPDPKLISAGYAELTWDPRGFGESGGVSEVDAPSAEGRDASALIDKVLTGRPEIVLDTCGKNHQPTYRNETRTSKVCGQPVVGMTGGSYGGGIQFATAAFDRRVKVIVPVITWNNLDYSLWPNNVIKLAWGEGLYGLGLADGAANHAQGDLTGAPSGGDGGVQTGGYDPNIHYAEVTGAALGYPDRQMLYWFGQRSMSVYGAGPAGHVPNVPTLLIQGDVDTLFNLNDAWANYVEIKGHHPALPVKLISFCGGHVSCPTGAPPTGANYSDRASKSSPVGPGETASQFDEQQTLRWFDHYLRGNRPGDGMPNNVVYQDQKGNFYAIRTFPTATAPGPARIVSAPLSGTLVSHGAPSGAGPTFTDGATNSSDPGQVTVPVVSAPAHSDLPIVGIGHVNATVTVNGSATELFFRLIDKNAGTVLDLQTQPLRVDNLDLQGMGGNAQVPPGPQKISLDLVGTSYDLPAGDTLELQVSTSTDSFTGNRGTAVVSIANGKVSVPTLASES
ncbi:MAG: CocE/NonD family hydrolase [Solirubrobacteraceae bacterium]